MPKKLPVSFRPYFWDTNFSTLDPNKSRFFIAKRVLDHGDTKALSWLIKTYGPETIKTVVTQTRDLSRDTANLWADIFSLDRSNVPCLNKPYSPTPFGRFS